MKMRKRLTVTGDSDVLCGSWLRKLTAAPTGIPFGLLASRRTIIVSATSAIREISVKIIKRRGLQWRVRARNAALCTVLSGKPGDEKIGGQRW